MDRNFRPHLAIALVSFAVLFYQVGITRILSVVLWYHFAFLSISLALLGVGAPGVWYALRRPQPGRDGLGGILVAGAASIPLSVVVITKGMGLLRRSEGFHDTASGFLDASVLLTVVTVLVPFLLLGAAVCLLLIRAAGREVGRMYGADLLGAMLGAVVVVPLMHWLPTPWMLAACGLLPLAAAALVGAPRLPIIVIGAVTLALLVWQEPLHLRHTKKYAERNDVLYEKWTPTGRIAVFPDVFHQPNPEEAFAWGMGTQYEPRPIEQLWIEQDGSAGTPVTRWRGPDTDVSHLLFDVTSVGSQLRAPETVCVIGAGGCRDVLGALACGAKDVDAVELNPHTVDAVSQEFREFSGDPYSFPGVQPIVSEGRSFLTRSEKQYDLLQISMVDSWAATSAGAFALSENYLYTVEAFRLYWERLSPDGLLSMSRWMMAQHLVESLRLLELAQAGLRSVGVPDPKQHLMVVQGAAVATLLLSKKPLPPEDIARLDAICAKRGFQRHWPPGPTTPPNSSIPPLLLQGPQTFFDRGLDLSAPTDDRPFFFQAVPIWGAVDESLVEQLSVNEQSVVLLRRLVALVSVLALLLFFSPFVLGAKLETTSLWRGSLYFVSIGLAFLFVEAAWIQRFILYLGHPSYATTVVLAALLFGAGLGSLTAPKLSLLRIQKSSFVLPILIVAVNAVLGGLFQVTLGAPFAVRVLVSLVVLVPSGFLMGFAFPTGMLRFGDESKAWFWALNGSFSVLASVGSLALAMLVGHAAVAYAGAAAYVGSCLLLQGRATQR